MSDRESRIHRQSNTDIRENLERIVDAFCALEEPLVFPAHPRTVKFLRDYGLFERLTSTGQVILTEPLGYLDMLTLLAHARLVLTDSGGVQKEAYLLRVPCVTLRESTEWVETVEDGWNLLVGTEPAAIGRAVRDFVPRDGQRSPFRAGDASRRIMEIIGCGV